MTTYLDEHPGGDDVILAATGIFLILSDGQFSSLGQAGQTIILTS